MSAWPQHHFGKTIIMRGNPDSIEAFDHLVIGGGVAGLSIALRLAESGASVAVVTKRLLEDTNTRFAQGGVACVQDHSDSFEDHVEDTVRVGSGLCKRPVVEKIVENGPPAVQRLVDLGAKFTTRGELGDERHKDDFDLGKEGGHSRRRVLHSGDITGSEIQRVLMDAARRNRNIRIFERYMAVDLITTRRLGWMGEDHALGAYVLDIDGDEVKTFTALSTTVAAGGAGKVYLYSSNSDVACGGGVAMCYRAGVPIANMEFYQFHPTILYDEKVRSFLISEAVRGEGAVLKMKARNGRLVEFMRRYHEMGSLAPRDVVARAIDNELKKSGRECAWLDFRDAGGDFIRKRFPTIYAKCLEAGYDMAKEPVPVVPAAHYCCGGAVTDVDGATRVKGLYAVGENACTGLHGANRLASNSLLEALVVAGFAAESILNSISDLRRSRPTGTIPVWSCGDATDSDELVVISHNWDEIRRFMWDYVGIVRTEKRLERAKARIKNIRKEIEKYYWDFLVTPDLIELRNIATTAEIIVDSAISRKESRGLHYMADHPAADPALDGVDTVVVAG